MNIPGIKDQAHTPAVRYLRRQASNLLRPRFLNELVVVPAQGKVIVEGTDHLQIFPGGTTGTLLLRLIPLMDGTRTLEELTSALDDVPGGDVLDAIALIADAGLVEEGVVEAPQSPPGNSETLSFFRRYLSVTHINRTGQEALRRLQTSHVVIIAPQPRALSEERGVSEVLKVLLEKIGVPRVTLVPSVGGWVPESDAMKAECLLVSFCFGQEDRAHHARLDDWCWQQQLPWLRIVVDPAADYADVGPLFNSQENACYCCFCEVHGLFSNAESSARPKTSSADIHFWTSVAATEIVYLLSRIAPTTTSRDFRRYDAEGSRSRQLRWPRVPGCARCRPHVPPSVLSAGGSRLLDTAVVFEDYLGLPSVASVSPRKRANVVGGRAAFSLPPKRLENSTQYPLTPQLARLERPVLDVLSSESFAPRGPITIDELATLLLVTGGIRDHGRSRGEVRRWAATGGNLGSVELYVAARNVEGLVPGFYFYQSDNHSLAVFRRRGGRLSIHEFMRRSVVGGAKNLPDALVLFTGAFHRVARKYAAFGYRLINMDAGAAMSQLHLAARGLSVMSRTAVRWADDLIQAQLNLDSPKEQITGAVELFSDPGKRIPLKFEGQEGPPPSTAPAVSFRELPVQEILQKIYTESRSLERKMHLGAFAPTDSHPRFQKQLPAVMPLPVPRSGGRLVGEVLPHRTSVRRYSQDPVSLEQLSSMLHCAHFGDASDWPDKSLTAAALEFVVLAWRVAGLKAGVYTYLAADHALAWLASIPPPGESADLFVQPEFATAPLIVWIAGDLAQECACHGAFGHRQLLLRAGAAAHRMWMVALGMGFSGAITAGLVPGEARRRFGFDGYRRASLLACASGR